MQTRKKDGLRFNFQEHYLSVSLPQTFLLTGTDDNTYSPFIKFIGL